MGLLSKNSIGSSFQNLVIKQFSIWLGSRTGYVLKFSVGLGSRIMYDLKFFTGRWLYWGQGSNQTL
jgi:hypothetical protein